jgi:hypothetical protein
MHEGKQRRSTGDSMSPPLFCIELIPLLYEFYRFKCGYQVYGAGSQISHLLYMDDLNLIQRSEEELRNEIRIVKTIRNHIKMELD